MTDFSSGLTVPTKSNKENNNAIVAITIAITVALKLSEHQ